MLELGLAVANPYVPFFRYFTASGIQVRVNSRSYNFLAFKYHIRYVVKTEQKIAHEIGKLNVHFDKWEPIHDLVSNVNCSVM